jgi:hypothetical protein
MAWLHASPEAPSGANRTCMASPYRQKCGSWRANRRSTPHETAKNGRVRRRESSGGRSRAKVTIVNVASR